MFGVKYLNATAVGKHQRRILETDPVFLDIAERLIGIPFEQAPIQFHTHLITLRREYTT